MTALRAYTVNAVALSEVAGELNLGDFMLLSKEKPKAWVKRGNIFWLTLLKLLSGLFILNMDTKKLSVFGKNSFGKLKR